MKISVKYFCLFSFLLMEIFSGLTFALNPEFPPTDQSKTEIKKKPFLTLCITIARRSDCDGFGICRLNAELRSAPTNSATATFYLDDSGKNVVIEIDRSKGITSTNYARYFGSGSFLMEEDFPLSLEIAKGIGLSGSKTLIAGQYRTVEKDGKILVYIPIK